ncbi:arsenate reductase ArsC [Paraburkholderia sp. CNPSo 3157]|uniref:Arsenate reductase ArsC n=1 Tax=Paraburkholderia franconis TaxID=2654983 RepID=A0A7X1N5N0_9BURK|nr:arsenate reductase ArsC [Paraburkholderia franconis]MPW15518.1 arsenate reductase ArsC [Paraburkholderia franconis]
MNDKVYNVLFLCTGNSARSILAEVQLNALGGGRFKGYSAGSHPKGKINPLTLKLLQQMRIPTEGLRSKSWDEFATPEAPVMDFVFTVCDAAAGEQCPVWPGQPVTAHWGVPDPAAVEGSDDTKMRAFKDAAATLRKRIELFKSLPLASLDRLAIKKEVTDIGKSVP